METQICTQCAIEKSISHFHKRKDTASGIRKNCKECANSKRMESVNANNKAKYDRGWYLRNREDRIKTSLKYQKANRGKTAAISANRRAKKLERTPKWLENEELEMMEWAYEVAKERTEEYGIQFEVDHIVPLQGKNVSGLHCPENLQVITIYENRCKSNKYEGAL